MTRDQLVIAISAEVVRFQEESSASDDVAAQLLAVDRRDLPCMTMLLFGGPTRIDELAGALHLRRSAVTATTDRLLLAGYARSREETRRERS